MPSSEVADALDGAADYLEQNGWCQQTVIRPDGQACALGAIGAATDCLSTRGQWGHPPPVFRLAVKAVKETVGWAPLLAEWNDLPDRSAEEVVEALRTAAARQRHLTAVPATLA